jgi:auxin responsive GH3 family protein
MTAIIEFIIISILRIIYYLSNCHRDYHRNQKDLLKRINRLTSRVSFTPTSTPTPTPTPTPIGTICYGDMRPYIDRIYQYDEPNVLMPGLPKFFTSSSGTQGPKKLLPKFASGIYGIPSEEMILLDKFPSDYLKPRLMLFNAKDCKQIGGFNVINPITSWVKTINASFVLSNLIKRISVSPIETFSITNDDDAMYQHLIWALNEPNLWCIYGNNTYSIVRMFSMLELSWDVIINDMNNGTFCTPNVSRIAELKSIYSNNNFRFIGKKIWPNLKVIICAPDSYECRLKYYISDISDISYLSAAYACAESVIGHVAKLNSNEYVLDGNSAYYEFLPLMPDGDLCILSDTSCNCMYELVITTLDGLRRYRLGDIVEVIDKITPKIRYIQKTNDYIKSSNGSHLMRTTERIILNNLQPELIDYIIYQDVIDKAILFIELHPSSQINIICETIKSMVPSLPWHHDGFQLSVYFVKSGIFDAIKKSRSRDEFMCDQIRIPHYIDEQNDITCILNDNLIKF